MSQIETSLFTLSIDDHTLAPDESSYRPNLSGHIRNTSCGGDSTNRWFDKSFSIIVESNSRFGMMGEHSPVDALIPSIIADWVVSEPLDPTQFVDNVPSASGWERICWEEDPHIQDQFSDAIRRAKAITDDSDADVLWFDDYGVDWIKNTGTCVFHRLIRGSTTHNFVMQLTFLPMLIFNLLCNSHGTNLEVATLPPTRPRLRAYSYMDVPRPFEP
jgi:Choline/Carnitine o-acyltransferase